MNITETTFTKCSRAVVALLRSYIHMNLMYSFHTGFKRQYWNQILLSQNSCYHLGFPSSTPKVFFTAHRTTEWLRNGRELSSQLVPTPLPWVGRWFHWMRLPKAPFKLAATTSSPGNLLCLSTQFHRDKSVNIYKSVWTEKSNPNTTCKEWLQTLSHLSHNIMNNVV